MIVDWTKPIQTRGGLKARLLGELKTLSVEYESRVVVVERPDGNERGYTIFEDGRYCREVEGPQDIINVPPRKVMREVEAWAVVDHLGNYRSAWSKEAYAVDDLCGYPDAQVVRLTGTVEVEVEE